MMNMQDDDEEKTNLDLITSSISVCITSGHTEMDSNVIEATRKYYLSIVNNNDMSIEEKRRKIYNDLVIGTKNNLLNMNQNMNLHHDINEKEKLSLKYRIGVNNDEISTVNGEIICVGQYKENDIYVPSAHVSRVHCFIFQINEKLIILDGWSKSGTKTIAIASNHEYSDDDDDDEDDDSKEKEKEITSTHHEAHDVNTDDMNSMNMMDDIDNMDTIHLHDNNPKNKNNKENLQKIHQKQPQRNLVSSLPKQRNILQYNISDTIHIKLGRSNWGTDIIINPKTCIVCMSRARVLRLKCGHQVLCKQCYQKMKQQIYSSQCPICRMPFNSLSIHHKKNEYQWDNHGNHGIIPSAGVHTFAAFSTSNPSTVNASSSSSSSSSHDHYDDDTVDTATSPSTQ